ncbi:SRPBCC family protein [Actinoallomurus iriomotensis]|uniref:Activator of HSP90 ATPase n=1 Tax=Actinoallomurus iriomotensis TaxID=478107 RepID=A0A9W6VTY9_9ACTN|nr:SRPBCC family protein [Actinoallomurus iriomotensis]GLY79012.1 activator of HSP90 ATPase [Actinoallomurus iriomotensis]
MIDVIEQLNSVTRTVGDRVLEAGEARVVTLTRTYDATVEELWDACTKPERIARWFLPISGELKEGGRFQIEGNAGGTIERCDPPESFVTTWEFAGASSRVEVRFVPEPAAGGTRFELEHTMAVDDHWNQFGPGAVGIGWESGLLGLDLHLSSGGSFDPAEGAAWAASEEGRRFMALSSERWCEAHIAGGETEEQARAAAARTTAAYTGTPPQES